MHNWLLFLHIGSVLVFMLAHGVQVTVTWRKRWQADPQLNQALFDALPSVMPLRITGAAVVLSGVLLVILDNRWGQWWVWLSLALLVVIWLAMWRWGAGYYNDIQAASEAALAARDTPHEATALAAFNVARLSWRTPAMTIVGIGGVAVILWLMIFRPA